MIKPSCLAFALLLALPAAPAGAAGPDKASVDRVVKAYVARLNAQVQQNQESVEEQQVEVADLDGDGKAEIVLLSANYGPTYWSYGVTVFAERGKGYVPAAESQDALGMVEGFDLRDGLIHVRAKWPGPNDPRCCPSLERTTALQWQGDKLVEAKTPRATAAPAASAPARRTPATGWQIRPVAGRSPVATVSGPGIVQSLSLICEQRVPVAAFVLKSPPAAAPAIAALELGGHRIQLSLIRPAGGGNVWFGDLRASPLPRLLVDARGSASVSIDRQPQGELALQGAGEAARAALSACYRF